MNAHQVTRDFEAAVAKYTGAPYVVSTASCTMALLLACAYHVRLVNDDRKRVSEQYKNFEHVHSEGPEFNMPIYSYVGVPCSIIHAGGRVTFREKYWRGFYQLKPFPIFDSARWFSSDMYRSVKLESAGLDDAEGPQDGPLAGKTFVPTFGPGAMVCVSFHATKTLGDSQGGAILLDDPEADAWLRRARFDGRTEGVAPKDDMFDFVGWHAYISPDVAARLLWKLSVLPKHNAPMPNDAYPDLSKIAAFK